MGSTLSSDKTNPKPLKILTLDGGGLQAIATLLILDELLDAIATQNGTPDRKPRPCDIFDCIAGIGAGGWLAILLGRFRMDIPSCLSKWYKIIGRIRPKSRAEKLSMRLLHHSYFDTASLVEEVDHLTKTFCTGDCLFENDPAGARTRHVFVAALRSDAKGYNLFRTYEVPGSAKLPQKLREGPESPSTFKISSAFAVTGAARYFTPVWEEQMEVSGRTGFKDTKYPKPHNITELALDEMWAIYGYDVSISVIVNLGPGQAHEADIKSIARRFSFGRDKNVLQKQSSKEQTRQLKADRRLLNDQTSLPALSSEIDEANAKKKPRLHFQTRVVSFSKNLIKPSPASQPNVKDKLKDAVPRTDTLGSVEDRGLDAKLRRCENEIEADIKRKLKRVYPDAPQLYFRLAPETAPQGTSQNDNSAPGVVLDATETYLSYPHVEIMIAEVVERLPKALPATPILAGTV